MSRRRVASEERFAAPDERKVQRGVDVATRASSARDPLGTPWIMVLEVVEPSLFLAQHPPALARFADEIARRVE